MPTKRKRTRNKRTRKRRPIPRQGLSAFVQAKSKTRSTGFDQSTLIFFKFWIGILLLPFCWVLIETFLVLLTADTFGGDYWRSKEFLFFGVGCFLWLALFYGFRTRFMMWCYVAGHELTHALFVLICQGKITKIHISAEGGHVLTNRNNFLISLSPYFFPFYTAVVILLWALMEWTLKEIKQPDTVWLYGLIGVSWMFHLTFTIWMIRREQPDLDQNGRLFSFVIIFIANILLICTMLIIASPTATFEGFGISLMENTRTLFTRFIESAREVFGVFLRN